MRTWLTFRNLFNLTLGGAMIEGKETIKIKGVKVCLKEYPNRILVITHNGNRDEIKELLEKKFSKPVIFLGELLSMTG